MCIIKEAHHVYIVIFTKKYLDITRFKRQSDTYSNRLCPVPRRIIVKPKRSNGGKVVKIYVKLKGTSPLVYKHWRRSAVNSAGALRGISGNFHPQKHTYAHFIL